MATLASTNISTNIAVDASQPIAFGDAGLVMEVFDVAGGAVDDTIVLRGAWTANILFVMANAMVTDNLQYTAANTNVTLTLRASAATNTTFQVQIVGRRFV